MWVEFNASGRSGIGWREIGYGCDQPQAGKMKSRGLIMSGKEGDMRMGWKDGLVRMEVRLSGRTDVQEELDVPANPPPPLRIPCRFPRRCPSNAYISISARTQTWDPAESVKWLFVGSLERLDGQFRRLTETGGTMQNEERAESGVG